MKINIKTIVIAMVLYGMFAGFAAAETPDAGDTQSTARTFALSDGYNFVEGQLTKNDPTDIIDCWVSYDASVGDYLELYLDANAYNNFVKAEMCDGIFIEERVMQCVYINGGGPDPPETILESPPVGVRLRNMDFRDIAYTFCIYIN